MRLRRSSRVRRLRHRVTVLELACGHGWMVIQRHLYLTCPKCAALVA